MAAGELKTASTPLDTACQGGRRPGHLIREDCRRLTSEERATERLRVFYSFYESGCSVKC